eukprot:ANDGO_06787.mRNA.1 Aldose 1-epimerase
MTLHYLACQTSGGRVLRAAIDTIGASLTSLTFDSRELFARPCFIMAPYANRIRNGKYQFLDQEFQLARPEAHAIHGCVRDQCWSIISQSDTAIVLEVSVSNPSVFPVPFTCRASYSVAGCVVMSTLSIQNDDEFRRMPVGGGFHPFFKLPDVDADSDVEAMLECDVKEAWPLDEGCLPTGEPVAIPGGSVLDFSKLKEIRKGDFFDACCVNWPSGYAVLRHSGLHILVKRNTTAEFVNHCVLYHPPGKGFVCIEPVVNANDGFNLAAKGVRSHGVWTLEPKDSFDFSYSIHIEKDQ